jgi:hypothetical protein
MAVAGSQKSDRDRLRKVRKARKRGEEKDQRVNYE